MKAAVFVEAVSNHQTSDNLRSGYWSSTNETQHTLIKIPACACLSSLRAIPSRTLLPLTLSINSPISFGWISFQPLLRILLTDPSTQALR